MPRIGPKSGQKMCRILAQNGFEEIRRKGSHIQMQKQEKSPLGLNTTITITVPNHKELAIGTQKAIIDRSQLPRSYFE